MNENCSDVYNITCESQFTILEKQVDILTTMNGNQDILITKLTDELIKTKREVRLSIFLTVIASALSIASIFMTIVCK